MSPTTAGASSKKDAIAQHLRGLITSGQIPQGAQLPTEEELAGRLEAARGTVREAIKILINEGLVVSRPRVGNFVRTVRTVEWPMMERDHPDRVHGSVLDPWLRVVTDAGYTGRQTIRVEVVRPDTRLTSQYVLGDLLDFPDTPNPADRLAVCRRRVRYVDDEPQELANSYYPLRIAQSTPLMDQADIQPGTYPILADRGYRCVDAAHKVTTRMPTRREAQLLELPPGGVPVFEVLWRSYTADRTCVLVRHSVYVGGDGNVFAYNASDW